MTETIEGTAVDVTEDRALVAVDHGIAATGALALAALPEDEFNRRLMALETGRGRVERIQKALMTKDIDYGVIPGTPKPTLYKPGAEMLCQAYSLAADFIPKRTIGDGIEAPSLSYLTRCELHLGSLDGPVIAVGYGACNSWEKRYRYRKGERLCPNCGKPAVIKGSEQYGGGWLCWRKKDGCGTKWPDGADVIEGQTVGDIENGDPFDLDVVLAKMAEKRAHVDATLRATNASRLFTQDVEDLARPADPDPARVDPETGEVHPVLERTNGGLIGIASLGKSAPVDGQVRETPDGLSVGFVIGEGREKVQVVAYGDLASALAIILPATIGARVQVFGPVSSEKMTIRGKTVPFNRLRLERIQTPDVTLPAVSVDPGATSVDEDDIEAAAALAFPEAESEPLGLVG